MTKEQRAAKNIAKWRKDPVLFVTQVFDVEPDKWQARALVEILRTRRVALSACKGPGKSCVSAWFIWWVLFCFEDCQGLCLSITADNLRDNLWKELAFWQSKSMMLQAAFELTSSRISSRDPRRSKYWWCSARSFPQQADKEQQSNALAGLHAKTVFVVLDEVGDYPEGVLAAAEGIFATEGVRAFFLIGGNPTNRNGPLYRVTTKDRKYWSVIHITGDPEDPERSPRISLEWAQQQIDQWGRDNSWVMVNVLGLFPPGGVDQLIDVNVINRATKRDAKPIAYKSDAFIWGLDPSRFGDDEACLVRRQGIVCFRTNVWRGLDGPQLAQRVAKMLADSDEAGEPCDVLFVDVGGVGASAYDHLKLLGWSDLVADIDFGGSPDDERFHDKRSEMWWLMAEWAKNKPACLPTDPVLQGELTAPKFSFEARGRQTKFGLETKKQMKKRGVPSPNRADALALTFAAPVAPKSQRQMMEVIGRNHAATDYDPFNRDTGSSANMGRALTNYDPLQSR